MENKTCATCTENDGGLCDLKGVLIEELVIWISRLKYLKKLFKVEESLKYCRISIQSKYIKFKI